MSIRQVHFPSHLLWVAALCAIFGIGCRQEEREIQCTGSLVKRYAHMHFVGFTPDELDTIRVIKFARGVPFAAVTDTIDVGTTDLFYQGDTASRLSPGNGFAMLGDGESIELFLPGPNRTFRISELKYSHSESSYIYTAIDCKQRTFNDDPIDATVTGGQYAFAPGDFGTRLFLKK